MEKDMITMTTDAYGTKEWRNEKGELHREDGPAVEWAGGSKHWYKNGNLHREDGPAFEKFDGSKAWYLNGKLHREDGPAGLLPNGDKYWCWNGKVAGRNADGFWDFWELLTDEQRCNPNLLKWIP